MSWFNDKSLCSKLFKLLFPLYLLTVTLKCLTNVLGRFLLSFFLYHMRPQIKKLLPRLVTKEPPWQPLRQWLLGAFWSVYLVKNVRQYSLVYHTSHMDLLVLPFACMEPQVLIHSANNVSKPHGSLLFGYFNGKWIPLGSYHWGIEWFFFLI